LASQRGGQRKYPVEVFDAIVAGRHLKNPCFNKPKDDSGRGLRWSEAPFGEQLKASASWLKCPWRGVEKRGTNRAT
jgi:hypothetical protein